MWPTSMVTSRPAKRKRKRHGAILESKRQHTFRYQFKINGIMIPVCKKFFLGTLNMKEWSIKDWSKKTAATNTAAPVQKVATPARSHGTQELYDSAKLLLDALPKLPSHYCRAKSDKLYLEPVFNTNTDLYKEYKLFCAEENLPVASLTTLKSVFKQMKLSYYSPKKDQCDMCVSYKAGNVTLLKYEQHLQRKEDAREEKKKDVELCMQDDGTVFIFADLQKVLLCPSLNASATYYKTKLCNYNYTVYDKKNT